MHTRAVKISALVGGLVLSLLVVLFAVGNYRSAIPIAEGQLRGVALSLSSAIGSMAARDPTFASLATFHARDIAYFALIDAGGVQLFHSNPQLIGTRVADRRFAGIFTNAGIAEARVRLGTGEEVYEFNAPLHLPGRTLALRLALHAYRAEAVVRRARIGMAVLCSLLGLAWVMGGLLYRYARRAETHRQEMARRERLAQVGELGAVIAHEVRNPLSSIKGYAQLLQERLAGDEARGFACLIVDESVRLESLVSDLLLYSRQEPRETALLDLAEILARCREVVASDAERSGILLEGRSDDLLLVNANGDRLEQLFLNLALNGLQAMPEGGRLTLTARKKGRAAEIVIADTGPGIAAGDQERIFEPFYTTRARGSGLGLAICKQIVEEAGGTIGVASEPGQGAVFTVTLPLAEGTRG